MSLSTDPNHKFVYAGLDDDLYDYSLSRHGTGSTRMDFVSNWVDNAEFSVGTTNFDAGGSIQTLIVWPTNDIPVVPGSYTGEVIIVSAVLSNLSGRVYFNANAEEASLIPSVWYVTNLLNVTSNDWQQRTEDFGYNAAGTNYEVWCQQVTPPVFYRIGMNVAP